MTARWSDFRGKLSHFSFSRGRGLSRCELRLGVRGWGGEKRAGPPRREMVPEPVRGS